MLHSPIVKAGPGSVELPRSPSPIVKANDSLLFVHFERPDLEKAEQYLRDFGLIVVSSSEDRALLARNQLEALHLSRDARAQSPLRRIRTIRVLERRGPRDACRSAAGPD